MDSENKIKCPYCGNNPTPHFLAWYFESMSVFTEALGAFFGFKNLGKFLDRLARYFKLEPILLRLGVWLRIISFNQEPDLCKVKRAQVLWLEAQRRGWKMKEMLLFKKPFDCYVVLRPVQKNNSPIASSALIFNGLPKFKPLEESVSGNLDDKIFFKKNISKAGFPVPEGGVAWNFRQAKKIFRKLQKRGDFTSHNKQPIPVPVVVKPRLGSRGRHSTTYIYNEADLKLAYNIAKQLCFWVVVEEQIFGPVYRATVIDYKLEGLLRGDSPQVAGNGSVSLKELIDSKNTAPHPGVKEVVVDEKTKEFIYRQIRHKLQNTNYNPPAGGQINFKSEIFNYKPATGEVVYLSEKIGVNYGGSSSEDFDICHPDNRELFERVARFLKNPVLGFDFIIPDISKSFKRQKCGFLEANTLPFINLHLNPLYGTGRNLAEKVWDMWKA